jgi:hypothetical protein
MVLEALTKSNTLRPYLNAVRSTILASLCIENFASQVIERHNKPEVEVQSTKEALLNSVVVSRNENERVLIETSINSVRISIRIKQIDDIERLLCHSFARFLCQRAEQFVILRRKPIKVLPLLTIGLRHQLSNNQRPHGANDQNEAGRLYHTIYGRS